MQINVYLPLLLSVALGWCAPVVVRRMRPALGARVLTVSAVLAALASTWGLVLLALTLVHHTPFAQGRQPVHDPVPMEVGAVAFVLLAVLADRVLRSVRVRTQTNRALREICRLCPAHGELAVLDNPDAHAYAVPGRPGRILVSSGLLRTATPDDRRVVLAHERAHLVHRHHRLRALTELAAALNPLLVPARSAVAFLVERWADEAAAEVVGSRRQAAAALARVALTTSPARLAPGALAFHREAVVERVLALQAPRAPSRKSLAVLTLGLAGLAALCEADATLAFGRLTGRLLGW